MTWHIFLCQKRISSPIVHITKVNYHNKKVVRDMVRLLMMSKANTANAVKIDSFDSIKPNRKYSKKVVKSLFEWAERILYRESSFVQDIAKINWKRIKKLATKVWYDRQKLSKDTQDETNIGDIEKFAPEDQRCKSLLTVL